MGSQVTKRLDSLIITDAARPYLQIQKGSLHNLAQNQVAWDVAYCEAIEADFAGMRPHLPAACSRILDIGGGMGGIGIMLCRHYRPRMPYLYIVDGIDDQPSMTLHRKTFNNATVAQEFLRKNGIRKAGFFSPDEAKGYLGAPPKADLIISLGAWCFHLPPEEYLQFVAKSCQPGTVLILDVRKDKPAWRAAIFKAFRPIGIILSKPKFERMVLHVY